MTYDIYNYISLRLVAYCRLISPLSCLFNRMKSCHERSSENLSLYFENGGPWKVWEAGQRLEKAILNLKTDLVNMGSKPK
jgi:hypothetical protein